MKFKAPTFELKPRRVVTIPFRGNLATASDICEATNTISYPFRIIEVKMIFPDESNYWIRHIWMVAKSRAAFAAITPVAGVPGIANIFGRESPRLSSGGRRSSGAYPVPSSTPMGCGSSTSTRRI